LYQWNCRYQLRKFWRFLWTASWSLIQCKNRVLRRWLKTWWGSSCVSRTRIFFWWSTHKNLRRKYWVSVRKL
jgi:hypothetical protein